MASLNLNTGMVGAGALKPTSTAKATASKDDVLTGSKHYESRKDFDRARERGEVKSGDTFVDNGRVWEVGIVIDGGRGGYSAGSSKFS